jgi:hypothetical protein
MQTYLGFNGKLLVIKGTRKKSQTRKKTKDANIKIIDILELAGNDFLNSQIKTV